MPINFHNIKLFYVFQLGKFALYCRVQVMTDCADACIYYSFGEYFLNDSFSPSDRSIFPIFSSHLIFVIDIHVQYPRQLFFFPERMQKCVKGREISPPYCRLFIKAWKII